MKPTLAGLISTLVICIVSSSPAETAPPPSPEPQPQSSLPRMLDITWTAGPHLPQGMQDNHVAEIDGWLVNVLGFCGGADDDWKPGKYPRGFLNKAWGLDLKNEEAGWVSLPDFPGAPRQAGQGAVVDGALYLWGGFSYDAPFTYTDGYRLSRENDTWKWEALPPLPSPTCWAGTLAVGKKIYALGGADYDAQRFYCLEDRTGTVKRLGARMIVFDTEHPEAGWVEKSPNPGTPRCLTGAALIGGNIYIMGGVSMLESGGYANVVDNWRYDPAADTWERLRDLPISGSGSSSSSIVYKDRYLLLPAGYQYGVLMRPNGTEAPAYGTPDKVARPWKQHPNFETTHYYNHHYVYDTRTNLFGTATPLPFDDVASITVVRGDTMYIFPGETGGFVWEGEYFGHHPEFVLKGSIAKRAEN
jgi:hypothetical protein